MISNILKSALIFLSVLFVVSCGRPSGAESDGSGQADAAVRPVERQREAVLPGIYTPDLTVHLYPQGQDVDCGIVEDGVRITLGPGESNALADEEFFWPADMTWNNVQDARILVYLPEGHDGRMILMCPGGGYGTSLTTGSEGYFAAAELCRLGHAVALLLYRMPCGHHAIPLTDAQNALRYCRAHAQEWGIDHIGVMGGSAGGHLAACVSTLYTDAVTRPDFTILDYPVISTAEEFKFGGSSVRRLTGGDASLRGRYGADGMVTEDTPPALLFHSVDDRAVSTGHSLRYFQALRSAGVQAQICIFPYGGHGWGFATAAHAGEDRLGAYREVYFDMIEAFLDDVAPL